MIVIVIRGFEEKPELVKGCVKGSLSGYICIYFSDDSTIDDAVKEAQNFGKEAYVSAAKNSQPQTSAGLVKNKNRELFIEIGVSWELWPFVINGFTFGADDKVW